LSNWAARGGFSASAVPFSAKDISTMLQLLTRGLAKWRGPRSRFPEKPEGHSFEAILVHYRRTLEHSSGVEPTGFMPRWIAPFICEAALAHQPQQFFDTIALAPPGLRYRLYNLLLAARMHVSRSVFLRALHHSDTGLVAVATLLLHEGLSGWELTDREQCSLSELEFSETKAVLSVVRGTVSDPANAARLFDNVVFDVEALEKARPIIGMVCPGSDRLLDALANTRSGEEAGILRMEIIERWESTIPLGSGWNAKDLINAQRESRSFVSKQYLSYSGGQERVLQNLRNLALGAANAPFLRIRNWSLWNALWTAILEASAVGCRVMLASSVTIDNSTASALARVIRSLQPEIVRRLDESDALQELVHLAKALNSPIIDESLASLSDMGPLATAASIAPVGRYDSQGNEVFDPG